MLLVLVLLVLVIYLASTCGGKPEKELKRRPFEAWRSRGQCPPVSTSCPAGPPPLLVISLDGFRADYITRGFTPMLQDMLDCGVTTPYVRTSFPSKTFPNHFSIVTVSAPRSMVISPFAICYHSTVIFGSYGLNFALYWKFSQNG